MSDIGRTGGITGHKLGTGRFYRGGEGNWHVARSLIEGGELRVQVQKSVPGNPKRLDPRGGEGDFGDKK